MSSNMYQLCYSPEFLAAIHQGERGEVALYQSIRNQPGVVGNLETMGSMTNFDTNSRLFSMATELSANPEYFYGGKIIKDTSEVISENGLTPVLFSHLLRITVNGLDRDVSTTILGTLGGRAWLVSSGLISYGDPTIEEYEDKMQVVAHQHTVCTNGLLRVLYGTDNSYRFDPEKVVPIELKLPRSTDEPSWDPPELKSGENENPGFEQFVGIDHVIQELRDFVDLANMPNDVKRRAGIGHKQAIIFDGVSGSGKTAMLKALGKELDAKLVPIEFTDAAGTHVAEWGTKLALAFENAGQMGVRVLITMDEMDGLIHSGNPGTQSNINTVMKRFFDNLPSHPDVFFAGAVNDIASIDPNVRADKRIPVKISLASPTDELKIAVMRKHLFTGLFSDIASDQFEEFARLSASVENEYNFTLLVREAEGLDIGSILCALEDVRQKIALSHYRIGNSGEKLKPSQADLELAIRKIRSQQK